MNVAVRIWFMNYYIGIKTPVPEYLFQYVAFEEEGWRLINQCGQIILTGRRFISVVERKYQNVIM